MRGAIGGYLGIIRRLEFGSPPSVEVWFRAVTWAADPLQRELVGYTRTAERAAAAIWELHLRRETARLAVATRGGSTLAEANAAMARVKPEWSKYQDREKPRPTS